MVTTSVMSCACPRHDAQDCYRERYGLDLRELLGVALSADEEEGECECVCHAQEPEDDDAEA